jgi:hypothetical protein
MHEDCIVLKVVHEALVIWEEADAEQRLAGRRRKTGWRAWPLPCRTSRRAPSSPAALPLLGSCLGGGAAWGGQTWRPWVHGRIVARWRLRRSRVVVAEVELGPGRVDLWWRCQSWQPTEDAPILAWSFFSNTASTPPSLSRARSPRSGPLFLINYLITYIRIRVFYCSGCFLYFLCWNFCRWVISRGWCKRGR